MKWRRLLDVLLRRPAPPDDERSIKAERLDELTDETIRTLDRVDQAVPHRYARIRREAMMAEERFRR